MESGPDSLFVTLLLVLHSSYSESEKFEVRGPTDPIVAVAGDDIILPCYLKPQISAEDMTVDWLNLDLLDSRVYRYQNRKIIQEDQIPSYIERTSLFEEELWRGNTSLKLTRVQGTDEGRYQCLIRSKSWYDEFPIQVLVKAVGSKPVVSIEGHREGGMGLLCESEGWHPEPELVWLDSEGVHLSAGPPKIHKDIKGFYTVKLHVIVQETDTNRFTCRVQQSRINEKMETEIHLPSELFDYATPWRKTSIVLCCLGAITVIGLSLAIYWINNKKDEVKKNLTSKLDDLFEQNGYHLKRNINLFEKNDYFKKEKDDLLKQNNYLLKQNNYLLKQNSYLRNQNVHAGTVQDLTCLLVLLTEQRVLLTEQRGYLSIQNSYLSIQNSYHLKRNINLLKQNSNLLNQNNDLRKERMDVNLDQGYSSLI